MEIRKLDTEDIENFTTIMRKFYLYSGEKNIADADLERLFNKTIDPHVNLTYYISVNDSEFIGIISMSLVESSYKVKPFAWVDDFFVLERVRGLGVGKGLIAKVKEEAKILGCSGILAGVGINEESVGFYQKAGFLDMECKLYSLALS